MSEEEKLLNQSLHHLESVCNHADEDFPQEYRSKWYDTSIADARAFVRSTVKHINSPRRISDGESN